MTAVLAKMKILLERLHEMETENYRLRDTMGHMHASYVNMATFNMSLRHQMRRNMYADPPPGIIYGVQTRNVGTQTFQPTDSD